MWNSVFDIWFPQFGKRPTHWLTVSLSIMATLDYCSHNWTPQWSSPIESPCEVRPEMALPRAGCLPHPGLSSPGRSLGSRLPLRVVLCRPGGGPMRPLSSAPPTLQCSLALCGAGGAPASPPRSQILPVVSCPHVIVSCSCEEE